MDAFAESMAISIVAAVGLVVTSLLGSIWVGWAIYDGGVVQTFVRFLITVGAGVFYLALLRASRRSRI